ncbi:thiamine biosynthesis protein ThiS [Legionella norrlandica]|uniref:Thiamine biosynthesis protein ThiS n=1 Tax=Legionella norrlandica TaxID=1498499 RepID=A0A0A2T8U8_9GAMM|nr:sulfur carrier protein ThiS [Legionella norrlandica]KGP63843.1 thiamine biosynthesis protein ThiS [Legionella norrlandica]
MVNIYLNDQIHEIESSLSLSDFLKQQNNTQQHFAVAINNRHIPKDSYKTTVLKANDRVDILLPMQGG